MRKIFDCGHKGQGQYCHRCANEQATRANADRQRREVRAATSRVTAIDLSPVAHLNSVSLRATGLLERLAAGEHPLAMKGKILSCTNGKVFSIPVGTEYRLLVESKSLRPLRIVSHQAYNTLANNRPGKPIL
ncbi:hypothetical protein [Paraburkholderia sp. SIMBA_054]|uniref:DUF7682 family zinc-binding protein n=1 Tax=Paraburkholderia sp. SIMBA_054 TaxID=3085795 RepID=UPI003979EB19